METNSVVVVDPIGRQHRYLCARCEVSWLAPAGLKGADGCWSCGCPATSRTARPSIVGKRAFPEDFAAERMPPTADGIVHHA